MRNSHTPKMFLSGAALLLAAASAPMAQDSRPDAPRVQVGDGTVDGSFIVAYTNKWRMEDISANGEHTPSGTWTDKMELIKEDGKARLKRTQTVYSTEGEQQRVMTDVLDHASLAPVRTEQRFGAAARMAIDFDGRHITGSVKQGESDPMTFDVETDVEGFNWGIYGTLIVAFPLDLGYRASFPALTMGPGGPAAGPVLKWLELEVMGREAIAAGAMGEVETWTVDVAQGPVTFRFWLSKNAPYIIMLKATMPDGSAKIWEMAGED